MPNSNPSSPAGSAKIGNRRLSRLLWLFPLLAIGAIFWLTADHASFVQEKKARAAEFAAAVPKLLVFDTPCCLPKSALKPVLEPLRREFAGRLAVVYISADRQPAEAATRHVTATPTLIGLAADGTELFRLTGSAATREEILAKFQAAGALPVRKK